MEIQFYIDFSEAQGAWILRHTCDGTVQTSLYHDFNGHWYLKLDGFDPVMLASLYEARLVWIGFLRKIGVNVV